MDRENRLLISAGKALCCLMALTLLICCAALGEEETIVEEIPDESLVSSPLPISLAGGYPPQETGYLSETVYEDPTIRVSIEYKDANPYVRDYNGRIAGYWVVDVQIGNASQLRTAPAGLTFDDGNDTEALSIAERVNAVVAINGDSPSYSKPDGLIIRQGETYRDKLKGKRDVLLIDEDGDFHVYHLPKKGKLSDTVDGKKVINAFYFGPILVEDGKPLKKMPAFAHLDPEKYYARIAICQVGPLHYKLIATTNKVNLDILGLPMADFAKVCADEGALIAYNLDGGISTTIYFNHERVNKNDKINFRDIPDIIYFASAWNGEDPQ